MAVQYISLTKGQKAKVSPEDYDMLSKHKWCVSSLGYAVRRDGNKIVWMHRVVNKTPKGHITDHINGDRLDNTRQNLRSCNDSQNQANSKTPANNTTGYKGVIWDKARGKYMARIKVDYKLVHLGRFSELEQAVDAYRAASIKYFGGFSNVSIAA